MWEPLHVPSVSDRVDHVSTSFLTKYSKIPVGTVVDSVVQSVTNNNYNGYMRTTFSSPISLTPGNVYYLNVVAWSDQPDAPTSGMSWMGTPFTDSYPGGVGYGFSGT